MEPLITAAARALEAGDPFGAVGRVALRDDAPALALRRIAMVQRGQFPERDPMSARSGVGHSLPVDRSRPEADLRRVADDAQVAIADIVARRR
jgi:hypothetical protein